MLFYADDTVTFMFGFSKGGQGGGVKPWTMGGKLDYPEEPPRPHRTISYSRVLNPQSSGRKAEKCSDILFLEQILISIRFLPMS